MENYNLTLSQNGFNAKPTKNQIAGLVYSTNALVTDDILISYLKQGYCFNNVYDFSTDTIKFVGKGIKTDHYVGSWTINIDMDHQTMSMQEMYDAVPLKPTFCYESWSNKPGDLRYRFIYRFNEFISGAPMYKMAYKKICEICNLAYDTNASSPLQYMNGTGPNAQVIKSGRVYSLGELNLSYSDINKPTTRTLSREELKAILFKDIIGKEIGKENSKVPPPIISSTPPNIINGGGTFYSPDKNLETDFNNGTPFYNIISKYKEYYRNIVCSQLPTVSEDVPMIDLPSDFYEVSRKWSNHQDMKGKCLKYHYGEHRKHKLYTNLMIRRLICPNLTADELLYDIIYEMHYYIDNSNPEHYITKQDLLTIISNVLQSNPKSFTYKRPRKRMVNPAYAAKSYLSKRQICNNALSVERTQRRNALYEQIGELYDCSSSLEKNLEILRDAGIETSIRTLKRFRKDMGLTRSYKKKDVQVSTLQDI